MSVSAADRLLSRDEFRAAVFARDGGRCVVCREPAKDTHHIVERRLWPDGGYFLNNGASVCEAHHREAESTVLSCDELRRRCGIARVALPPHLYADTAFDKWGNPVLPNGQRLRGELFHDESVQKVIAPVLHLFSNRVKHPRTFHLPWSPGVTDDDRVMPDLFGLEGEEVVATVKMDGEQTSMYRDGFHARSVDPSPHPSRDWLWGVHRRMGHEIPENWRVCGENLYAVHSITYRSLPAHFLVHSVWDDRNECLPWAETEEWAALLGFGTVPVLWRGPWDEARARATYVPIFGGDECEGYVVRVARRFRYQEYPRAVGKYVRAGHVQPHGHWSRRVVVNGLAPGAA